VANTTHVDQTFIRATPEQVWQAINDLAWTERYVRVTWEVDAAGDGLTRVRLVHGDLAPGATTGANVEDEWGWVLAAMKTLIETGSALPDMDPDALPVVADPVGARHRSQAIEANNSIWELLDGPRSADDDEELVRRAYAAAYHWDRAAGRGPEHAARAAYMIAKAQLAVGQPALALAAADRCMALCTRHALVDFDLAYAHEGRARALHALGRGNEAQAEWQAAHAVPIADPQDREILEGDLAVPLG
jgi:hypothetical protein